uniref:Uncharacterized protein n=1 Tax=Nelumbo nucifera TaxID=4432 RepID=A0A822ZY67_NELNU|nr:TPA_asm: hypothetical protein HUJ06_017723 [Nelumbo nucifera]
MGKGPLLLFVYCLSNSGSFVAAVGRKSRATNLVLLMELSAIKATVSFALVSVMGVFSLMDREPLLLFVYCLSNSGSFVAAVGRKSRATNLVLLMELSAIKATVSFALERNLQNILVFSYSRLLAVNILNSGNLDVNLELWHLVEHLISFAL